MSSAPSQPRLKQSLLSGLADSLLEDLDGPSVKPRGCAVQTVSPPVPVSEVQEEAVLPLSLSSSSHPSTEKRPKKTIKRASSYSAVDSLVKDLEEDDPLHLDEADPDDPETYKSVVEAIKEREKELTYKTLANLDPLSPENHPERARGSELNDQSSSTFLISHSAPVTPMDLPLEQRCLHSFSEFFREGWHVLEPTTPLQWNWHLDMVCTYLQAMFEDWMAVQRARMAKLPDPPQRIQNLIINIPPGTSKSRIVSVFFPAWVWLWWPSFRWNFVSANPRVSLRDSVYCRDLLKSSWYRNTFKPTWSFAKDQDAKTIYRNSEGGFRQAFGAESKITGDRGDALVLDDPNDVAEADSDQQRQSLNDWWDSAAANRINDLVTSLRIGVQQRVHEDDWTGHVLPSGVWHHLVIQQEYEDSNGCECVSCKAKAKPLGVHTPLDPRTEPGELLDARRYPRSILSSEVERLGEMMYAAQHQQRPAPEGGGLFKAIWWNYWIPHGNNSIVTEEDTSKGTNSSWLQPEIAVADGPVLLETSLITPREEENAGPDGAKHVTYNGQRYAKVISKRVGEVDDYRSAIFENPIVVLPLFFDEVAISIDTSYKDLKSSDYMCGAVWGRLGANAFLLDMIHQKGDFNKAIKMVNTLCRRWPMASSKYIESKANGQAIIDMMKDKIPGLIAIHPEGDKIGRARAVTPLCEARNVYLPHPSIYKWVKKFRGEVEGFPGLKHDDIVDMMTQILKRWFDQMRLRITSGEAVKVHLPDSVMPDMSIFSPNSSLTSVAGYGSGVPSLQPLVPGGVSEHGLFIPPSPSQRPKRFY